MLVQTRRIVDREGKDRIVLTAVPKIPDLTLLDPTGEGRLTLDITDDHKAVLQFSEGGKRNRVMFGIPKTGAPALRLVYEHDQIPKRLP